MYFNHLGFTLGTVYSIYTQKATLHEQLAEETVECSEFGIVGEEICM